MSDELEGSPASQSISWHDTGASADNQVNLYPENNAKHRLLTYTLIGFFCFSFIWFFLMFLGYVIIFYYFKEFYGNLSFAYEMAPVSFLLVIMCALGASLYLYLIVHIGKMTRFSWYMGLLGELWLFVIVVFLKFNVSKQDALFNQIYNLTRLPTLTSSPLARIEEFIGPVIIFIPLVLLAINYKKFNRPAKANPVKLIILVVLSTFFIGSAIMITGFAAKGAAEKPFIGASKVESALGHKSVYFHNLPPSESLRGLGFTKNVKVACLNFFSSPYDANKTVIVLETIKKPAFFSKLVEVKDSSFVYYTQFFKETQGIEQFSVFQKNGLYITFISPYNKTLPKGSLLKMAESAY